MADNTKNSLSTLLTQFLRLNRNALEIFERINEAVTSSKETVNVDIFDDENNIRKIQIPSFGFLKSEIERLNNNIENLSNLNNGGAKIKLKDGTYRTIINSKLKGPSRDIVDLTNPSTFDFKNNWFFEDMLNPLMYINIDISGQIEQDTEKVITRKYLLQLDTHKKKNFFNDNFNKNSNIDFMEFNRMLLDEDIDFILDEDIREIPPQPKRFVGRFDILRIHNIDDNKLTDGKIIKRRKKLYKLNKLTYTDLEAGFDDTISLKEGDSLAVISENYNTRYKIVEIDSSTNEVELKLIEGAEGVNIGINKFEIYRENDEGLNLEIPISFDKYIVMFIKGIDAHSNIPSNNWSPGTGFYTNSLTLKSDSEETVTLETFYQNQVTDFGVFLMALAKDGTVPASLGLAPNKPEFTSDDLKVVQINKHITENPEFLKIKSLSDDRDRLVAEIKELDKSISEKKTELNSKQYSSSKDRDKSKSELNSMIEERVSASKLLSSIVDDIESKIKSDFLTSAKPKMRVRGFIPIPEPRSSKYTGIQEIVAIEYEYRYLGKDGNANKLEEFSHVDDNERVRGNISNWQRAPIVPRVKIEDEITGEFYWEDQELENSDQININQIDIPINHGESIEIRARSLSEAGYPGNPKKSEWSDIVKIDFPEYEVEEDVISDIIEENYKESQRIKLEKDLEAKGVITHIDDQFMANEKNFKHLASNIFSGFFTEEQSPIDLFEKLIDFSNRIQTIEEQMNKVRGELKVKILDEEGNEIVVEKNKTTKLFAGYYKELVKDLEVPKGEIITRTFFISLENTKATPLELISRLPGNRNSKIPGTGMFFEPADVNIVNDNYLLNNAKYDGSYIVYTNPHDVTPLHVNESPYQSSQLKGKFIYARGVDITGENDLYSKYNLDMTDDLLPSTSVNIISPNEGLIFAEEFTVGSDDPINGWIWASGSKKVIDSNTIGAYNVKDKIFLHVDHPNANDASFSEVSQSKYAILNSSHPEGKKQIAYFEHATENVKCAFEPDDKYNLGPASVGSYMFIASENEDTLSVNGDNSLSVKVLDFGFNNSIQIPLIFQFRMTDYAGIGDTGEGFVAGDPTGSTKDVIYSKKMGFDIFTKNGSEEDRFSFDIEIFAKYRSDKLNLDLIPVRKLNLAIDDLRQATFTPNIDS